MYVDGGAEIGDGGFAFGGFSKSRVEPKSNRHERRDKGPHRERHQPPQVIGVFAMVGLVVVDVRASRRLRGEIGREGWDVRSGGRGEGGRRAAEADIEKK